jgi:hypothetical protein
MAAAIKNENRKLLSDGNAAISFQLMHLQSQSFKHLPMFLLRQFGWEGEVMDMGEGGYEHV